MKSENSPWSLIDFQKHSSAMRLIYAILQSVQMHNVGRTLELLSRANTYRMYVHASFSSRGECHCHQKMCEKIAKHRKKHTFAEPAKKQNSRSRQRAVCVRWIYASAIPVCCSMSEKNKSRNFPTFKITHTENLISLQKWLWFPALNFLFCVFIAQLHSYNRHGTARTATRKLECTRWAGNRVFCDSTREILY